MNKWRSYAAQLNYDDILPTIRTIVILTDAVIEVAAFGKFNQGPFLADFCPLRDVIMIASSSDHDAGSPNQQHQNTHGASALLSKIGLCPNKELLHRQSAPGAGCVKNTWHSVERKLAAYVAQSNFVRDGNCPFFVPTEYVNRRGAVISGQGDHNSGLTDLQHQNTQDRA